MALGEIESYDIRADQWIDLPLQDNNGPRAYYGATVIDNQIYIIGGFDGFECFNTCRRFDSVNKKWDEVN